MTVRAARKEKGNYRIFCDIISSFFSIYVLLFLNIMYCINRFWVYVSLGTVLKL
ncbi:hypothetical protein Scep_024276 [Stephania cephalantha]|uniref:Uncharacterized protein n=1 Tax=Stephania cephalantha TaxID=152367 RepID=A0AAP0HY44_9MAGN